MLLAISAPVALILPAVPIVLAMWAFFGGSNKAKAKPKKDTPSNCPPLPALSDADLGAAFDAGVKAGVKGLLPMTSYVARALYSKRDDGSAIPWPTQLPYVLPVNLDGSLVCRWNEIRSRLADLPVPESPAPTPGEILSELLSDFPLPGKLYQIKSGDNLSTIVRKALNNLVPGAGEAGSARMAYLLNCINVSEWNRSRYGSTRSNNNFPKTYFTNGLGLAAAFLPRNADATAAILAGKLPARTIKPNGDPAGGGSKFGMLWLPPVVAEDLTKFAQPTCAGTSWPDGSSTIEPPPEFLALLH